MKFIRNKPVREISNDEMQDNFLSLEIKNKSQILIYMKSFLEPSAYTSQPVIDRFTNQELDEINNAFSDGTYTWYADEIFLDRLIRCKETGRNIFYEEWETFEYISGYMY